MHGRARGSAQRMALAVALVLAAAACGPPKGAGHLAVATEVARRTGHVVAPATARIPALPVTVHDGLTEDEAVALGLWQNPGFRDLLVDLDLARAAVVQAGLLTNPTIAVLFPLGPKQLELAARVPIEALWLRPPRLAAARADDAGTVERIVQGALDLVRDVRVACAELRVATERAAALRELTGTAGTIAEIAAARFRAGDTSELEIASARANAALVEEEGARAARDVETARIRLATLLGLAPETALTVAPSAGAPRVVALGRLVDEALAGRPDLRAAQYAIRAAEARSSLGRRSLTTVAGIADANGKGTRGFEMGPGVDVSIPIFDWNQGNVARADAELLRAVRREAALRERVRAEVTDAYTRVERAREQLELLGGGAVLELERAVAAAERAFRSGDASYLLVLETTVQFLRARVRTLDGVADLARAWAELERNVGVQLAAVPS